MTTQVTKIRRTRSMTVVTTPTAAAQPKTTPAQTVNPHTTITRVQVTPDALKDPTNAARIINQIQSENVEATRGARTNPMNAGGVIVKGIPWTAGAAKLITHNLGRAPAGYEVLRSSLPAAASAGAYGSLYNQLTDNVQLVSLASSYVQLTQSHAGPSSGTTLTTGASGKVTVTGAGAYAIEFMASVNSGTTAQLITGSVFINGVEATDIQWLATSPTTGTGTFNGTCRGFRPLSAGDVIDARVKCTTGTITLNVGTSSLTVLQMGAGGGGTAMTVSETTLPAGLDSSVALNLVPSATCTADLMVY